MFDKVETFTFSFDPQSFMFFQKTIPSCCPERPKYENFALGVAERVAVEECLCNKRKMHNICFKMPDTVQYNIALTLRAFKEFYANGWEMSTTATS